MRFDERNTMASKLFHYLSSKVISTELFFAKKVYFDNLLPLWSNLSKTGQYRRYASKKSNSRAIDCFFCCLLSIIVSEIVVRFQRNVVFVKYDFK